ncbi:MAG: FKBP-type peptidyl-prolyl cis-trans isomerase [Planctomycetota bacterium]
MKTRICVVMLLSGCLVGMSVCAARKSPKEKSAVPPVRTDIAPQDPNQKASSLKTEMDKVSYSIGVQLGQQFKKGEIDIKIESLMRGIKDTLAGKTLVLSEDEMQKVMTGFQQRMMAKQKERQKAEAAKNLAMGMVFLEANGTKEGVKVLPSGMQYKIIRKGTGKTPTVNDRVKTNYRGTLIDGTEFDSSYKRNKPAEFPVKGVIRGWTEALQLMKEGGKWELYIPANLAYGEQARRTIPGNSTLIFEIELLEVLDAPKVVPKK